MTQMPFSWSGRDSQNNVRSGSGSVTVSTASGPSSWQEAFDSRDMRGTQPARDTAEPVGAIRAWYEANTGHDPSLSYEVLPAGTWTINQTWLTAREGNGRVSQSGGRWYVERYETPGTIRVAVNNITLSNIYQNSGGALYGFQSRALDGNATGVVLEHSTLAGNAANDNGAALNFPDARNVDQITLRHCEISGYRAGLYCFGGITAEYCWVHDLHFSPGSHNTGASMRAGNNHLARNLIADGNSSAISWYPEYGPYTNNIAEENVLRLANADDGPEVILASARAFSDVSPGDTRILRNNLFYRGGNRGEGGGVGGFMAGFTTVSGNIDRLGEAVG